MFLSIGKLANELPKGKPDNLAANALQEGLGGQFGEMRTMMQYLFQNFNFRGKAKPYQDLKKCCWRRDRSCRIDFYYDKYAIGRFN
jgi:Mn-containing catalase